MLVYSCISHYKRKKLLCLWNVYIPCDIVQGDSSKWRVLNLFFINCHTRNELVTLTNQYKMERMVITS